MASILFVMRYPLHCGDNLITKFDGQMAAARSLGHQVHWLGWSPEGIWLCGDGEPELIRKTKLSGLPGYHHTLLHCHLMDGVKLAVDRVKPDLIYLRFMRTFAGAPAALAYAKQAGAKLVVEHPTYPFDNGKTTSLIRKPFFWYCDKVFARIEPMIDLYTLIGDPCDGELNGRPAMNILNGVDVDRFPLHVPRTDVEDIHMLALASMSRWQGYDRLLHAMAAYQGEEKLVLHMAGEDGDGSLAQWRSLAEEMGISHQVVFEGAVYGRQLDQLVAQCDIGIGGLGLYRKNQFVSMPLKLREYMACGLPFVYAVDDPTMPEEPRFCLRLPNDDTIPDMEQLIRFAKQAKQDTQAPALMHAYAKEYMSWEGILKPVFERLDL